MLIYRSVEAPSNSVAAEQYNSDVTVSTMSVLPAILLPVTGEAAAKAISNKEFQHLQQLITEYEAQESVTAAGTSAATTNQTSSSSSSKSATAASSSAAPAAAGSSEDGVSWAGEVYEKDELRGVERGYLKFSKRLARQPEQCAR